MIERTFTFLAIAVLWGCGATTTQLTEFGFEHGHHTLRVAYAEGHSFAASSWRVDNLQNTELGEAVYKRGPEFTSVIAIDHDNDGEYETQAEAPRYELRLIHDSTPGLIWLSHLVLASRFRGNDLRSLAHLYVDSIGGGSLVLTSLGGASVTRFATRIVSEGSIAIDGYEAFRVVFEVANVDQLQLSEDSRWRRAEIVLIRSGFLWYPPSSVVTEALPTILVAGHENLPGGFSTTTLDFDRFLASIDFRRGEMEPVFETVRSCTSRDWVRVQLQGNLYPPYVASPDVDEEERECLQENIPSDLERGFAFRRAAFVAPEPVVREANVPPDPVVTPEVPAERGVSEAPAATEGAPSVE